MKFKKEYLILALVIIALVVYLFVRKTDRTLYRLPAVAPVAKNEISKIQITRDGITIELDKKDDHWYIAPRQYPADAGKVKRMLDSLEKLTLTALVSESKDYRRYDLGSKKKIAVKAWQGNRLKRDFEIGKTAASFRHTFVKLADNDRVFHARGNFRSNFDVTADNLRDKTVLAFAPADIRQLTYTSNGKSRVAIRNKIPSEEKDRPADKKKGAPSPAPDAKTVWQTAAGDKIDTGVLKALLGMLSGLHCQKFIDGRKKEDFKSPLFSLQLTGGRPYSLAVFAKAKEKDNGYPAVSSESAYPFQLSDSQVEKIKKDTEKIVKPPATEAKK